MRYESEDHFSSFGSETTSCKGCYVPSILGCQSGTPFFNKGCEKSDSTVTSLVMNE